MEVIDNDETENMTCPYFERMGVCLEPMGCCLRHKVMSLNAAEFVPGQYMQAPTMEPSQAQASTETIVNDIFQANNIKIQEVYDDGEYVG